MFSPAGSEPEEDPHILVFDDGTFVLDNEWWLNEEAGTTMPSHVLGIFASTHGVPRVRRHGPTLYRCSVGLIPVTFIIGRFDDLVPSDRVTWAERHFEVRILDCDHFIIFREPGFVADVVIEKCSTMRVGQA